MAHQTADDITASLDKDRRALGDTLAELRARLDPQALLDQGTRMMGEHAMPALRGLGGHVRANPVPYALMGAGAAWLLFSGQKGGSDDSDHNSLAGGKYEAVTRWEDEGGNVMPEPDDLAEDEPWIAEADGLRARASDLLAKVDRAARDRLAPAAELARNKADVLAALTRDVRAAMSRGLEGLGEQARTSTLAAREAAYSARIAVGEKSGAAVRDNPFVTGGLLAIAGAALAAALPRTEAEARTMGSLRDQLVSAAQRYAADEIERAGGVARDLAESLRQDLDRAGDHVAAAGEALVSQAGSPAAPTTQDTPLRPH